MLKNLCITEEQFKQIQDVLLPKKKVFDGVEVPFFEEFHYTSKSKNGNSILLEGDIIKILSLVEEYFPTASVQGPTHGGYQINVSGGRCQITIQMDDFFVKRILVWDFIEQMHIVILEGKHVNISTLEDVLKMDFVKGRSDYDKLKKTIDRCLEKKYLNFSKSTVC